ncbi:MAG: FAD-dependent oxidoreductase [Fluviicola sp.]|jgi:FAD/FMN-containing dehydrogenase
MNRKTYHPLRKLVISGNPNKKRNKDTEYTPPLEQYLKDHNIESEQYKTFVSKVNCQIITPFDADYENARKESDNAFNKYPLLVAYCTCSADVVESIKFCNNQNIEICLRAGGHSTAGYSVLNGRMLIDVSNIKGIFVDSENMYSVIGSGVTWGDYNYELNAYGLHNPGGSCDTVGITGYTLGGGYGYTSMKWGIACDNLLEIKLVTANGDIVIANKDVNQDLYWAHRGGTGGNFGVVVSLKFKLYQLKKVWPLEINWSIDDAAKVLTEWQNNMTKNLQDKNLGLLGFLATRQITQKNEKGETTLINEPYFCIRGIYSDDNAQNGQLALQPLLNIGNPSFPSGPLWQIQVDYCDANEHLLDNVEGVIPDTIKETKRCAYVQNPLTEEQYQKMVDYFKTSPNLYNIVSMEPYGGAINEIPENATAFVHRNAYFDIFTDSFWQDDKDKEEAVNWLSGFYNSEEMKDLWSNNYYQNYPNSDYSNWQNGYFGSNYSILQSVKRTWDPTNRFNYEQSIEL